MKFSTSLIVALMLLFAIGCEDEIIVNPDDDDSGISLTITGLPDELAAPNGSVHNLPITVVINRSDGTVASGVAVGMSTNSQVANMNPASGNTDGSGCFETTLNLVMPQGSSILQVTASAGGISATASIQLTGTPPPHRITLNADATTLTVPTGHSGIVNIDATVTDFEGVGVPGVRLKVVQYPDEGEPDTFGALTKPDPTDAAGQTSIVFNSHGGFGGLVIKVSTDIPGIDTVIEAEIPIRIVPLESRVAYLNLVAYPDELVVAPGQQATSIIRAQVIDADRHGIAYLRVNFDTNLGSIASSDITDQNGMIETDFITDFQYGLATITATITNTEALETVDVMVRSTVPIAASIGLMTDRRAIYADNGYTTANLVAFLNDTNGACVPNVQVVFSATHGAVTHSAITDSLGRATAIFTDRGRPSINDEGQLDSAVVTASYIPNDLHASVKIMIRELYPVHRLDLMCASQQMVAGTWDSTGIRVTAYLLDESPAQNGTLIYCETYYGFVDPNPIVIGGNFGAGQINYYAGNVGNVVDTVRVYWENPLTGERVYSNDVLIRIYGGPPAQVTISADPTVLITNNPTSSSRITATVLDIAGNPVRAGTYVGFTSTLGAVNRYSTTDETGRAYATLTPGREAGIATVTATVSGPEGDITDDCRITFIPGSPSVISFSANPMTIPASGGGRVGLSTLRATIYDVSGNLVIEPTTVVLQLINQANPPYGCTINDTFPCDSALTENGVATATLESGTSTGLVRIRAYTWRDSMRTDTISTYLFSLSVVGGAPHQLDIDVSSEGEDIGGGSWSVEVSARVWDASHNPVQDIIPVSFTVEPEVASVEPGYTGNQNRRGASTPGVAFSDLVYHSIHTLELVTITAQVQTADGIIENSREFALPLQRGNLSLNVDPENWMFQEGQETARIRCSAMLMDGHEIPANNAPVSFTSSRGRFSWFNFRTNHYEEFYPAPARKLTGQNDDVNQEGPGGATVFLIADEPDIFLDPFTLQTTVSISARVEGYEDVQAQPRYIQFTRHG